jgi:predicted PhzF superfamily epimerase YddE/YHI9
MKQLRYILVGVFTNQPFGGNQLDVFPTRCATRCTFG